jgi:hypothetical protein
LNRIVGGVLIAIFALYVVSLIFAIYKGVASPSELSDSDSNGEYSDSDDGEYVNHATISENSPLLRMSIRRHQQTKEADEAEALPHFPTHSRIYLAFFVRIHPLP